MVQKKDLIYGTKYDMSYGIKIWYDMIWYMVQKRIWYMVQKYDMIYGTKTICYDSEEEYLMSWWRRCPRSIMVKAMDCVIVVNEFGCQSRYYVHFQTNTLGKSMNTLIFPAVG